MRISSYDPIGEAEHQSARTRTIASALAFCATGILFMWQPTWPVEVVWLPSLAFIAAVVLLIVTDLSRADAAKSLVILTWVDGDGKLVSVRCYAHDSHLIAVSLLGDMPKVKEIVIRDVHGEILNDVCRGTRK